MKQAYARTAWPWAAPEEVVMHAHGGGVGEVRGLGESTVAGGGGWGTSLNSLFHLCHHDHLWVLVHLQVPKGEENDEMTARRGTCRSVTGGRDGGRDFPRSYLRPRRSFGSYNL